MIINQNPPLRYTYQNTAEWFTASQVSFDDTDAMIVMKMGRMIGGMSLTGFGRIKFSHDDEYLFQNHNADSAGPFDFHTIHVGNFKLNNGCICMLVVWEPETKQAILIATLFLETFGKNEFVWRVPAEEKRHNYIKALPEQVHSMLKECIEQKLPEKPLFGKGGDA